MYKKYIESRFRQIKWFRVINKIFSYTEQERVLKTCVEFVQMNKIDGDYLEFGVFEGKNFARVYNFFKNIGGTKDRMFYAFDSFEGLPEIKGLDNCSKQFTESQYSCGVNKFKYLISKKGIDLNHVKIIEGWFDKTLNKKLKDDLKIKKSSIIFIDCDLYESTIPVLNFITDYIQDGTIIIFDDYFCFNGNPNKGERKAFDDWLKKIPPFKQLLFNNINGMVSALF
ncbi:MAG: TylF/MycF/NovP-related O-methyltransferase [archaeon]